MHLSLLSDILISDQIADAGAPLDTISTAGRLHAEGLVRGLCVLALLALPFLLTFGPAMAERAATAISAHYLAPGDAPSARPSASRRS